MTAAEREQQRGRERWLAMRAEQNAQDPSSTLEERQALAREHGLNTDAPTAAIRTSTSRRIGARRKVPSKRRSSVTRTTAAWIEFD
jgi:hypothetical protein